MAYEILVGARCEECNGENTSVWYEGVPCNPVQLVTELNALAIPGVRTYSAFGRPGECAGVYAWDDSAPLGEFWHILLSTAEQQRVQGAILAHVPKSPS